MKTQSPLPEKAIKILRQVKRHILKVPRSFRMGFVWTTKNERAAGVFSVLPNKPKCGTAGCFAGWICALNGETKTPTALKAAEILGLDEAIASRLFFGATDYEHLWNDDGSIAAARDAAARIEDFIRTGE